MTHLKQRFHIFKETYYIQRKYENIQGAPQVSANTYRDGRGGQDEQKIIWEGGSKMQPWGVMGKILFLRLVEEKNS